MSLDLRSLRIELTLDTTCYEESGRSRRYLCEAVHLICKKPDSKLVRHFDITHYKRIRVSFSETGLKRLLQTPQRLLAYHAESVTIDRSAITEHHDFTDLSRPSGFSEHSWWESNKGTNLH
ncbi:hypothetical protein AA0117_g10364 [Alternaria alternata]|jgi:hypothetical protein|uniref:Uncharacterized protein n=1 Tax=Alternaria alternata TaxID=5599 RepID=A0A4Q4N482_ALTAL|nr:hypothetical protein AA0117_g10364 [Alternaria alternata]